MTIDHALGLLHEITADVHFAARRCSLSATTLFDRSYGLCELMTKVAMDQLPNNPFQKVVFVGIQIPARLIQNAKTYSSHTVGVLHRFPLPGENEKAIIFDYACAQYGIDRELHAVVLDKELLYEELRHTYGGGIWQPGGDWLAHLDVDLFIKQLSSA